jgi:hypothetical protein
VYRPHNLRLATTALACAYCLASNASLAQQAFGAWKITQGADGRPVAVTTAKPGEPGQLSELRIECVAGGRLEYAPVALKPGQMLSLWFDTGGNILGMRLVNGRASGADAVALSREFSTMDANIARGGQADWSTDMSIESENGPMSDVPMGGFSNMRRFMLANCKG